MRNPWLDLPTAPPYVLAEDAKAVEAFNRHLKNERHRIETDLLPEPFVGDLNAPIIMLALNPGVSDEDFAHYKRDDLPARIRRCHAQKAARYPLYYLDPEIECPGATWWVKRLAPLWNDHTKERVAKSIAMLEFFPYHSRGFGHEHVRLPSQEFTFGALRDAMARDALVVAARGWRQWVGAVPELLDYANVIRTASVQNITLSRRNLGPHFGTLDRMICR